MTAITIEDIETLVVQIERENTEAEQKLLRLICAEARILAGREPSLFPRKAIECADEDGHWDNSFPPKQVYKNRTGPRLLTVRSPETSDIATSSGFYYEWKRVTSDAGLHISPTGEIYGAEQTGTGRLGQFAAHPGDCSVEVEISYSRRSDVSIEELREIEAMLRAQAFPSSQAA